MTIPRCFCQIWFLDTEYSQADGECPRPICLVAREYWSGTVIRLWLWNQTNPQPPFRVGPDVLVVCYLASAEWAVFLVLGWQLPVRIVCLCAEHRWLLSGFKDVRHGQIDAMGRFGLPAMDEFFKTDMRARCIEAGPFSPQEAREILAYCEEDVNGLALLFAMMERYLQWPQALARGRYTAAVARMEALGVPIDRELHGQFVKHRRQVRQELVNEAGAPFGVFDADKFDTQGFEDYLTRHEIAWPRTPTGRLSTAEDSFEDMAEFYPELRPLQELRSALGQLKDDGGLAVGGDGRNRSQLWPFGTSSGRNAPSTTKYVFGKSVAFRSLIKPDPGWAVAYIDWAQQEFGIAAVQSDDHNMRQAYLSGDPYLEFAKQAGAVPSSGTKAGYPETRELFKSCLLAVNYSMGYQSLARKLHKPFAYARELLGLHKQVYRRYWKWVGMVQNQAMLTSNLHTIFGWQVNVPPDSNWRSLRNFLMQGNGAEMLRLACCLATERGIRVVAPVHDAVLIEGPVDEIKEVVRCTQDAMVEASRAVLDGFTLRTDAVIVCHPERYRDRRGAQFWSLLTKILGRVAGPVPPCTPF
jgi:hypothetical protein